VGTVAEAEYRSPVEVLGIRAPADFLSLWLQTGEEAYASLYRGICVAELSALPAGAVADWAPRTALMLGAVDQRHPLSSPGRAKLEGLLRDVHANLPTQSERLEEVRVLFVGDCLLEEVELFLSGHAATDGLLIRPKHVVSKNPVEQHRQLKAFESEKFAAVFLSPFTYAFNPDFAQVLELSQSMAGERRIAEIVHQATQSVAHTIDVLASTFECPIFVNNASTLQRGTTLLRRVVKSTATARTRHRAATQVNGWLAEYVEKRNRETFRHLFVLDEAALAPTKAIQERLGAYLLVSEGLHPTRFAQRLAETIAEHVQAVKLCSRKLVICDLDNTLWDGVIGEGLGVTHHQDRQRVLLRLKEKGVILTIASKNDPANVVWNGGVLDATAFVASEVSWAPKVQGIQRMYQDLNIKPKDGVFIDDKPDERSMVKERWPQMLVADPNEARTWRIFGLWADLLDGDQEFDRTAMYQQREKRDQAMSLADATEEAAKMFRRLELKARLTVADKSALKRVCELINRTNQWNLNASRTTLREVEQWSAASDYRIITVQVDDKFGPMGTVCVAVIRERPDGFHIPIFVLSCRVFGFGVETLVLDYVKRLSLSRFGAPRVRGFFTATEHNAPCKDMYREHGYAEEDSAWVYSATPGEKTVPDWFTLAGFQL
jgi:FkbH-like protein